MPAIGRRGSARSGLVAGLAFLDATASDWTAIELASWLETHLVRPGLMKMPRTIRERDALPVDLREPTRHEDVRDLVHKASQRVVTALRGMVPPAVDDRFLNAAIYGGRVRRGTIEGKPAWIASPKETDFLAEMVLSLFAADVLMDRDYYAAYLCVCFACGAVTFQREPSLRTACEAHGGR